jgi:hypothetical protein
VNAIDHIRDPGPDPAELACQAEEPEASPSWDRNEILNLCLASIRWALSGRTAGTVRNRLEVVLALLEAPRERREMRQLSRGHKCRLYAELLNVLQLERAPKCDRRGKGR